MSLFGSLMGDVEDDPFFGSHMRHMRQLNHMMNSMISDPFGSLDNGRFRSIGAPRHMNAMMPFMPQLPSLHMGSDHMGLQMPSLDRLFSDMSSMGGAGSYSSSTVVMSSGPGGNPQVYSSTNSTNIGPGGIKETRKTLQDSRTGIKKMSIGHHIGDRAHIMEREANLYSGDQEERQEYINLDEEEGEEFDREFQMKAGAYRPHSQQRARIEQRLAAPAPRALMPAPPALMPAPDSAPVAAVTNSTSSARRSTHSTSSIRPSPSARRAIRGGSTVAPTSSASVRDVYSGPHPQRHRPRHTKHHQTRHDE